MSSICQRITAILCPPQAPQDDNDNKDTDTKIQEIAVIIDVKPKPVPFSRRQSYDDQ